MWNSNFFRSSMVTRVRNRKEKKSYMVVTGQEVLGNYFSTAILPIDNVAYMNTQKVVGMPNIHRPIKWIVREGMRESDKIHLEVCKIIESSEDESWIDTLPPCVPLYKTDFAEREISNFRNATNLLSNLGSFYMS